MVRPAINSEKHIVQVSLTNVTALDVGTQNVCVAVASPGTSPTEVRIGSVVKAVYIELWLLGAGQQPNTSATIIYKVENNPTPITFSEMQNLEAYTNKKNILEMHQGLVGDANTNPSPFYRGWIKIPKGKQRIGLGDAIKLTVSAITEDLQFCGVFIYKEYF